MNATLWAALTVFSTLFLLYFSVVTYALRDFSHTKLAEHLGRHNADHWYETLTEQTDQYIFVTAFFRMLAGLFLFLFIFIAMPVGYALLTSILVSLIFSIILPHAAAKYAAEPAIGFSAPLLNVCRIMLTPLTALVAAVDEAARRALGVPKETEAEEIEQEIMSVVEEGEKEGVVDEQERALIENVIEFRDATAGQIMTPRTEIVSIEVSATLDDARALIESSGYSRLPAYEETLDRVTGILYARDLIRSLGQTPAGFDMRSVLRPAMFVPETKPLRNLLTDFRHQKVHIAIVLDEYGGTAGLVTIEDILEELVGEIEDEHEPSEPTLFRKLTDASAEADARLPVSELNAHLDLSIPEEAGYETVGGYLMTAMGRIPEKGAVFESDSARFTVLEAEPQRIVRLKIELLHPATTSRTAANRPT